MWSWELYSFQYLSGDLWNPSFPYLNTTFDSIKTVPRHQFRIQSGTLLATEIMQEFHLVIQRVVSWCPFWKFIQLQVMQLLWSEGEILWKKIQWYPKRIQLRTNWWLVTWDLVTCNQIFHGPSHLVLCLEYDNAILAEKRTPERTNSKSHCNYDGSNIMKMVLTVPQTCAISTGLRGPKWKIMLQQSYTVHTLLGKKSYDSLCFIHVAARKGCISSLVPFKLYILFLLLLLLPFQFLYSYSYMMNDYSSLSSNVMH